MEATLLMAGFAIGGILVIPAIKNFIQENLPFLLMGGLLIIGLVLMTPYSREVRVFWNQVNVVPQALSNAIIYGKNEKARMANAFHSAFGG